MYKMIKKTRFVIIYLVFIFLFFLSSCCNREQLNTLQKERNIALIVKMQNGDYWNTVKMGADAAAKEFNINLAFMAPNDEEDVDGQIQLVNQAIDQKVDALILAASDYDALTQVTEKAYSEGIPVIIIDAEVNTDKIVSYIATDNYAAGKKAGKKLIEVTGDNCKVAIMSFVKGAKNAVQRETGLISITAQCPEIEIVAKEYCFSDPNLAAQLTKKMISKNPEIDAIVALNAIASIGVAQAIDEMSLKDKVKVITFASTPEEIKLLEKGVIQATIIQNPFTMGYLGVKYGVDALNGKEIPKQVDTGSTIIDKNNMYLPENQKLVFPFVK